MAPRSWPHLGWWQRAGCPGPWRHNGTQVEWIHGPPKDNWLDVVVILANKKIGFQVKYWMWIPYISSLTTFPAAKSSSRPVYTVWWRTLHQTVPPISWLHWRMTGWERSWLGFPVSQILMVYRPLCFYQTCLGYPPSLDVPNFIHVIHICICICIYICNVCFYVVCVWVAGAVYICDVSSRYNICDIIHHPNNSIVRVARLWDGAIPHQARDSGCSRPVVPISQHLWNEDLQGRSR